MTEIMNKEFSRKSFLKGGGAMIVGFSAVAAGVGREGAGRREPVCQQRPARPCAVDSWIAIHADNTVSVMSGAIELGQGTSVGIAVIAAEELDVDLKQMRFVNQDTNVTPNTGQMAASASIENRGPMVRAAAVEARKALLGLASTSLGVPVAALTVASGVVSGGGKSVTYGELLGDKLFSVTMPASYGLTTAAAAARTARAGRRRAGAKPISQYKLVGTDQVRFDIPAKVTGSFTYVHNIKVPGMLHARVVRPRGQSAYPGGAPVVSVDESSIGHIPGARLLRKGDFLAVVAEQEYVAVQAAAQLKVTWADPPASSGSGNSGSRCATFDAAGQAPARIQLNTGDVNRAFATAATTVSATYMHNQPGHLPIGPSCAVADVRPNGAVVFTNTQRVYTTRDLLVDLLGLPVNSVRVIYREGSSCFGASPYDDAALAAALTSQLAGRPVRLQFMRWDEHGWDNSARC